MKNAKVLVHHYGDDGNAYEGRILRDVTQTRFEELERAGLVREATAAELKEGSTPAFESEAAAGEKQKQEPNNKAAPARSTKAAN